MDGAISVGVDFFEDGRRCRGLSTLLAGVHFKVLGEKRYEEPLFAPKITRFWVYTEVIISLPQMGGSMEILEAWPPGRWTVTVIEIYGACRENCTMSPVSFGQDGTLSADLCSRSA